MKRILVFSDTHGKISKCIKVIDAIKKIDLIIHLGDVVQDVYDLKSVNPHIPIEYVLGNNDFFVKGSKEKVLNLYNKKIFMTHGHMYRVKTEYETIKKRALKLNSDLLLFGHTHEPYEDIYQGIKIMNPGSISIPNYSNSTYGVIEIEKDNLRLCICEIY